MSFRLFIKTSNTISAAGVPQFVNIKDFELFQEINISISMYFVNLGMS